MRYSDLLEGGWASTLTQNTIITPVIIKEAVGLLKQFEIKYNSYVKNIDPQYTLQIGHPVGSGTYYKRDLINNPEKEYGDVDVAAYVNPNKTLTVAQITAKYREYIIDFCKQNKEYITENGTNVIFKTSAGYVQIDLIYTFHEYKNWAKVLAPEHNVKGAISTSLTSAMAEVLNLSFGTMGIQTKLRNNEPVSFRQSKDVVLKSITKDPHNWAKDVYSFYYELKKGTAPKTFPKNLIAHGGYKDEQRIGDIILSIKALAEALDQTNIIKGSTLLSNIANSFVKKMDDQIGSSKFKKAQTEQAKAKAEKTKAMFAKYRDTIPKLLMQ